MTIEDTLGPRVSRDPEDLEARAYDFGRMGKRVPSAVAAPESADEVADIVRRAAGAGVGLIVRGAGHSQGGQTLTDGGVVLDTTRLDRFELAGPDLLRAQGGAQWGKVVDALRGTRRLPCVLVDIGEVTVGGTLSAGGVGTTSQRYGVQAAHVEQLEVVTGTGARVLCSAARNKDLFDAVRGGQGQFGIITEAWVRLRPAGTRFRQYELRYRDAARFADDLEQVFLEDRFDHLRAEFRSQEGLILLNAGVEYDEPPDDARTLRGLGHEDMGHTRDTSSVGRAGMWPSWGFNWMHYHPWRDWIMPWETLRTLIAQPWLDASWLPPSPWSWTGSYPIRTAAIDAPLVAHPPGERGFSYSVLTRMRAALYEDAQELVRRLHEVDKTLVGLGGKSYLSGRLGYGREQWAAHYGDMLEHVMRWKREFDPQHVFRGRGMPFGDGPADADR